MKSIFSKNLIKARKLRGWSQQQAANFIGIKRVTYASYEESRAEPSNRVLSMIAEVYQVHDDIYGFINNRDFFDRDGNRRKVSVSIKAN